MSDYPASKGLEEKTPGVQVLKPRLSPLHMAASQEDWNYQGPETSSTVPSMEGELSKYLMNKQINVFPENMAPT